jgi:isopentenyl-diphosphate Delta-isomerase
MTGPVMGPDTSARSVTGEEVVLLDEQGRSIGTAPKGTVHTTGTPLHLAFSCYVFDPQGALLVTRRATSKPTWPGVWTNSFCGHPAPGEQLAEAVARRAGQELGLTVVDVRLLLPAFRYRAVMANGVVENEMCPVYAGVTEGPARPDPAEVEEHRWIDWDEFRSSVLDGSRDVSPWCVEQVAALPADPATAPALDAALLPPAAR